MTTRSRFLLALAAAKRYFQQSLTSGGGRSFALTGGSHHRGDRRSFQTVARHVTLLTLSLSTLNGCNSKALDRDDAFRQVSRISLFSAPPTTYHIIEGDHCFPKDFDRYPQLFGTAVSEFQKYAALRNAGLVTLDRAPAQEPECRWTFGGSEKISAFFTQAGKDGVSSWQQHPESGWLIPISAKKMGAITGIRETNPGTAIAEFTWFDEPTSWGHKLSLPRREHRATAVFQRFDDGWRLQSVDGVNY